MKVLFLAAAVCLLSGANAGAFTDTLHSIANGFVSVITDIGSSLKQPVTDLAGQLVDNLKTAGTSLLTTGATSLLGSLSHLGETSPSKRDLSLLTGVTKFIEEGKQIVGRLAETLGGLYHNAVHRLADIAHTITSMDFLKEPLNKILGDINEVVDLHSILQSSVVKTLTTNPGQFLVKAAEGLISKLGHKRNALTDTLSGLGLQFVSLFKPVVDAVTEHVHSLGTTLSQTATALFGAVQPALGQLGQQLLGHVQVLKNSATELLTHGTEALKALSAAA